MAYTAVAVGMNFFIADTHFGHAALIEKMGRKGFKNIDHHDAAVLDAINRTVKTNDRLFILGDFSWEGVTTSGRKVSIGGMRQRIWCKHVDFIIGNHDKRGKCEAVFGALHDKRDVQISNGRWVTMSHYPWIFWEGSHHGDYHVYGHCHAQREHTLDTLFPERRSMDVGVDNAIRLLGEPRPFSERDLIERLESRAGHDPVSFYEGLRTND